MVFDSKATMVTADNLLKPYVGTIMVGVFQNEFLIQLKLTIRMFKDENSYRN